MFSVNIHLSDSLSYFSDREHSNLSAIPPSTWFVVFMICFVVFNVEVHVQPNAWWSSSCINRVRENPPNCFLEQIPFHFSRLTIQPIAAIQTIRDEHGLSVRGLDSPLWIQTVLLNNN
jgi:hypothetical protein